MYNHFGAELAHARTSALVAEARQAHRVREAATAVTPRHPRHRVRRATARRLLALAVRLEPASPAASI